MKSQILIAFFGLLIVATACYDETDPVAEIIAEGKGYYPVSANSLIDLTNGSAIPTGTSAPRTYTANTNVSFELQYWSDTPIQEINLYSTVGAGAKTKIFSKPYSEVAAFSRMKSTDTLILMYKTPMVLSETNVNVDVEILNENGLSLIRTLKLRSKP